MFRPSWTRHQKIRRSESSQDRDCCSLYCFFTRTTGIITESNFEANFSTNQKEGKQTLGILMSHKADAQMNVHSINRQIFIGCELDIVVDDIPIIIVL